MKRGKKYIEVSNQTDLAKLLGLSSGQEARLRIRNDLVLAIYRLIEEQNLTHAAAAKKAGIGRTIITSIVNGNIAKISTDRLLEVADRLGLTIKFKIAS